MNKKKIVSLLLISALSVSALAGCGKKNEETEEEQTVGTNVSTYEATLSNIETTVTYTGELKPSESVSVSAKTSAKATSVNVKEGDYVSAGTVLAQLEKTDLQLTYNQTLASYNSAKAQYDQVVNATTKQSTTSAQQTLESAQNTYDTAKTNYEREKASYEQNATVNQAQLAYDQAVDSYNRELELYNSGSSISSAQNTYNNAKTAYENQKALIENDTTMVSYRNNLKDAQDNLERTQQLYDIGAASEVTLTAAQTAVENAQAAVDQLETQNNSTLESYYTSMVNAEISLNSTITNASASVDSAYTAMQNALQSLESAKINASASLDSAESNLRAAETALKAAKENKSLTSVSNSETIASAKAGVDQAKAALDSAQNNLNNTTITAPISGYIASRNIEQGEMVSQGVTAFTIKNVNSVEGEINVTESVITKISEGTRATVSVASAGVEDIDAVVTLVNPTKDDSTGLYTVKVTIPNDEGLLNSGMFADITLVTDYSENVIVIPTTAILEADGERYVYIADGDTAEKSIIIEGISDSDYTEITAGVSEGDLVVVSGKDYLSEINTAINVTSTEAPRDAADSTEA